MDVDPLLARARQVWTGLAGSPISFPARQVAVAASANSSMCPPGWVGVVALGDAAICTVPTDDLVGLVTRACRTLPVDALTDPDRLSAVLPVAEVLGPAALAYCDDHSYRPHRLQATEQLPVHHPDLVDFLASVPAEDAAECGLVEITSAAYVLRAGTAIVAAAGYRHWPGRVAHLSVLTAPRCPSGGLDRQPPVGWRGRSVSANSAPSSASASTAATQGDVSTAGRTPPASGLPPLSNRQPPSYRRREGRDAGKDPPWTRSATDGSTGSSGGCTAAADRTGWRGR